MFLYHIYALRTRIPSNFNLSVLKSTSSPVDSSLVNLERLLIESPANQTINSVLLLLVGVLIGGASNIIGTAITADIGKQEAIGRNVGALSTVTGI